VSSDRSCPFSPAFYLLGGKNPRVRSDTKRDEVERYEWIRWSPIQEAGCLTFVRARDPHRVAAAFGAVAGQARNLDFEEFCEEAFAHHDKFPVIGLRRTGDWILVAEDNGGQGSRPEVLRRVSTGAEAVSAFWDTEGLTRFTHAAQGDVRTSFEALMPECRDGTRPDALEEARAGLPWSADDVDRPSLMLALGARITGQALTPEVFDGDFLTYPVAAWLPDLPETPESVPDPADGDYPPELIAALRGASREAQRRAVGVVARQALECADCLDHPVLGATLARVTTANRVDVRRMPQQETPPSEADAISEVVRSWTWKLKRHRATSTFRAQVHAAEVLRQATNVDPLTAVFAALSAAERVRGIHRVELARQLSEVLDNPRQSAPSGRADRHNTAHDEVPASP
jgi:hypothetical protein